MNDSRAASIFPDDLETLEAAGELLFRYHENTAGIRLLAIALRLRGQTGIRQAGMDVKITGYSGFTDSPVAVVPSAAELTERESPKQKAAAEQVPREPVSVGGLPPSARSVSFACDIDESAGMAEVVELRGYSRKTPCA